MLKIGVFDSGVGGLSVAHAIQVAMPDAEVLFMNDTDNVPYGTKSPKQLFNLVQPILNALSDEGCDVIVIACNTVSTTIIDQLKPVIKTPLIPMEPMVQAAAKLTKSGVIAVCATPTTLASRRYEWLKNNYASKIQVLEPNCSDWSSMIENDKIDRQQITDRIEAVCQRGADVIVLGCTHYHWIENLIIDLAHGRAQVLQPEQSVIKQLQQL